MRTIKGRTDNEIQVKIIRKTKVGYQETSTSKENTEADENCKILDDISPQTHFISHIKDKTVIKLIKIIEFC